MQKLSVFTRPHHGLPGLALKALLACAALATVHGVAHAQLPHWERSEAVLLSAEGDPDVYFSSSNGASAYAEGGPYEVSNAGDPLFRIVGIMTHATASSPAPYNHPNGLSHAYTKVKYNFTWVGGGTPVDEVLKKRLEWSINGVTSLPNPYVAASFEGNSVTTLSGNSGWVTGHTISGTATSGDSVIISCGSGASAGYSYGGAGSRGSLCKYEYDFSFD